MRIKYPLIPLVALLLLFNAFVVKNSGTQLLPPPGTELFKDNLYVDQDLVTNLDYLEFMYYAARYDLDCNQAYIESLSGSDLGDDIRQHLQMYCFTEYGQTYDEISPKIIRLGRQCQQFKERGIYDSELYMRSPAYHNYPVIGVTKAQAEAYCKWRTAMVKAGYLAQSEKQQRKLNMNLEYRLPTMVELEDFALYKGNQQVTDNCIPMPSYYQQQYGGFTNVAEYTRSGEEFLPNTYSTPSFTGFRCVCEIKNN